MSVLCYDCRVGVLFCVVCVLSGCNGVLVLADNFVLVWFDIVCDGFIVLGLVCFVLFSLVVSCCVRVFTLLF